MNIIQQPAKNKQINKTTVKWDQLSNGYRANEHSGKSGESGNFGESGASYESGDSGESGGKITV